MGFTGLTIDEALRKFQMSFLLPGEAQKIERLMEVRKKDGGLKTNSSQEMNKE